MLTVLSNSKLCRSKCFFLLLRSLIMLIYANLQIFLALLLYRTSPGVSYKQPEQIWCLNMKSIEDKTLPVNLYHLSSGHMDTYTIVVSGTQLEYLPSADISLFLVLLLYNVFYVSLSFIIKLKLNSWVLKYLSTHPEYLSTWVFSYIVELNTHL